MATSSWSSVFLSLLIGIGGGLVVAFLLYVLRVIRRKLMLMRTRAGHGGLDVHSHPGGLPSTGGVPNGGVEGLQSPHAAHAHATAFIDIEMAARQDIAEVGKSADPPASVDANVPNEETEA